MYTIPTISELRENFISHYETESGQKTSRLPVSWIYMVGTVIAGVQVLLHRCIKWATEQSVPQTADEATLQYMAESRGLTRKQGTAAVIDITITGESGTMIPAGTMWLWNNITFQQNVSVSIGATSATASATATTIGSDGTPTPDDELSSASPIAGVTGATVASVLVEGTDQEDLDEFRERIINKMRNPPQGGSAADYITWALEVDGIKKAFATRSETVDGQIIVYPLQAVTGEDRIPDATLLQAVEDYISDTVRRPLAASAVARACTEKTVNVTVSGVSPSDVTTKANIEESLKDYFYKAYPKQYRDDLNATNVINIGDLWECVRSGGATATNIEMNISGIGQTTSYTLSIGEIVKAGEITWA